MNSYRHQQVEIKIKNMLANRKKETKGFPGRKIGGIGRWLTIPFLLLMVVVMSCSSDDNGLNIEGQNFLVFGHFYGMCVGDRCVLNYKLTDEALFKDTIRDYYGQNRVFVKMEDEQFEKVKDLADYFPQKLLKEKETVIGCPDCADGGGLLVEYSENGKLTTWRIDMNKNHVPDYLHDFMDKIQEKINLLNP